MGEFDLIAEYFTRAPQRALLGVGDDCALFENKKGMHQCITSDMLVEGRHFLSTVDPYKLGVKSLAVNLSDLAACGATPTMFTLSLALPDVDTTWLERFSIGLWDTALKFGVDLVGGDTTRGPLCISITALGEVPPGDALLRSGATPGDDIYISGTVGDAAFALDVFRGNTSVDAVTFEKIRQRLEEPTPRVALGTALRGVANACIDLSDGLIGDLNHILQRSQVGANIDTNWIEDSHALSTQMRNQTFSKRLDYMLRGGDDYELLFTASKQAREEVIFAGEQTNTPVTLIGHITAERGLRVFDLNGDLIQRRFVGFEHFQ